MRNFRQDSRGGFNSSGGRSGGSSGGRGGFRDRNSSRSFEKKAPEMHKVICAKCKKECEVPFRPTGDKPVFCRDCFGKEGDSGSSSRRNFNSGSRNSGPHPQPGISQEQFKQINAKLDKILEFLDNLEVEEYSDEDEDEEDEDKEDK
jgi:CxxC-x17-CxxC domain-containing protein